VHNVEIPYNNLLKEFLRQCVVEGWSEKLKDQADEGCNLSGRIRVNKVIGNINISPGRSYQAGSRNFQDLVPYLRDDGNPHDFSHMIHEFFFMADDEYNPGKAKIGKEMKQRMGIAENPLDGVEAKVNQVCRVLNLFTHMITDDKGGIHVSVFPQTRINTIPHAGW